ncbi:MAG: site-specific integrase [Nitrospirae bacterium]|nr:site-specific integrase [Nitrospirota bacterium]
MAKATRDTRLENRTARAKLVIRHQPYFKLISEGLHLGYRKGKQSSKWIARLYNGKTYIFHVLAEADDFRDSNGIDILNYFEAQDKARKYADDCVKKEVGTTLEISKPYTVQDAVNDYLNWFKLHRRSYDDAVRRFDMHILPVFAKKLLSEITTREISTWQHGLLDSVKSNIASDMSEDEIVRRKKASINRILNYFKAALNKAFRDGYVDSDIAWRRVKPFDKVDQAKIRFLSQDECIRLINACSGDFKPLVHAALLTGGRYGELIALRCYDYNHEAGTIHFRETKNGKPRYTPLTDEGKQLFEQLTAGREKQDYIFLIRGRRWTDSLQIRRMVAACKAANINPPVSFHILRHSYASFLAVQGVPLQVIATLIGHSDMRITTKHYAHLKSDYVADTLKANLPSFGIEKSNVTTLKLKKGIER